MPSVGEKLLHKKRNANVFKYDGSYNEFNQRHGYGKSLFPNGDEYTGFYSYGKRHGFGIYKYNNGATYIGDFCNGWKTGLGKMVYPDGSSYDGKLKDDERHGFGIYRYPKGDVYEGNWEQNKRHGLGKYTHIKTSMQYVGTWVDGFRSLDGNLFDVNRAIYMEDLKRIEMDREAVRTQKKAYMYEWNVKHGVKLERTASEMLVVFFNEIVVAHPGGEGVLEQEARKIWWDNSKERSAKDYERPTSE